MRHFFQFARVNHHFQRNNPQLCRPSTLFKLSNNFVVHILLQLSASRGVCVPRRLINFVARWEAHAALVVAAHGGDGMACMALNIDLLALRFQQDNFQQWSTTNNSK